MGTAGKVLCVIPARIGAERLDRKPLRTLAGRPLVEWVARNAQRSGVFDDLVVATDSHDVVLAMQGAGIKATRTSALHDSGTSRVAEVAAREEYRGFDVVVNVQGDEPFLPAGAMHGAVRQVEAGADIGTAAVPLAPERASSPHVVKVVADERGRALYFSRHAIPFARDGAPVRFWQHLGVYAYRPDVLFRLVRLPPTEPERAERLEQLRALGHGLTIGVERLDEPALPGIDTEDDLERAEAYLATRGATLSG